MLWPEPVTEGVASCTRNAITGCSTSDPNGADGRLGLESCGEFRVPEASFDDMSRAPAEIRIAQLAGHPELLEQVGILRWKEWAYGEKDPARFIEVSREEAGDGVTLPLSLVAISSGSAVGVVGLGPIDDEVSTAERAGRSPWILGMVVAKDARLLGVGRLLLAGLQEVAAANGHSHTWVATGREAVGFYRHCGWEPVEELRLESTGIPTTILGKPT